MLAFFCLGARYRPWRYFAALHSRVFGDGAMHRAVPAARSSRASTLSFVLLAGAFSKSCLRRRFYAGRAAVIWCGRIQAFVHGKIFANAFSGDWQWQYTRAVRSRALDDGKMLARCVPQRPTVAGLRPDALLA